VEAEADVEAEAEVGSLSPRSSGLALERDCVALACGNIGGCGGGARGGGGGGGRGWGLRCACWC
jgi:hypothetical protein